MNVTPLADIQVKCKKQPVLKSLVYIFLYHSTTCFSTPFFTDLTLKSTHSAFPRHFLNVCRFITGVMIPYQQPKCSDLSEVAGSLIPSYIYLRLHWCPSALWAPGLAEDIRDRSTAASTVLTTGVWWPQKRETLAIACVFVFCQPWAINGVHCGYQTADSVNVS